MQALKQLGINLEQQVPITELLSENFNGQLYSLTASQRRKIAALRDIVTEYTRSHRETNIDKITSCREAADYLGLYLRNIDHEEVWIIFLSQSMAVIKKEMLFKGSITEVLIHNKTIIAKALSVSATGIIIAHNHPSGNPAPSHADISRTEDLKKACNVLEIALVDHVIISHDKFYSFSDEQEYNF